MPKPPSRLGFTHVVGAVAPTGRDRFIHQVSYNVDEPIGAWTKRPSWCGRRAPLRGWQEARDDSLDPCERCI